MNQVRVVERGLMGQEHKVFSSFSRLAAPRDDKSDVRLTCQLCEGSISLLCASHANESHFLIHRHGQLVADFLLGSLGPAANRRFRRSLLGCVMSSDQYQKSEWAPAHRRIKDCPDRLVSQG
jgi:hypothetical protein